MGSSELLLFNSYVFIKIVLQVYHKSPNVLVKPLTLWDEWVGVRLKCLDLEGIEIVVHSAVFECQHF